MTYVHFYLLFLIPLSVWGQSNSTNPDCSDPGSVASMICPPGPVPPSPSDGSEIIINIHTATVSSATQSSHAAQSEPKNEPSPETLPDPKSSMSSSAQRPNPESKTTPKISSTTGPFQPTTPNNNPRNSESTWTPEQTRPTPPHPTWTTITKPTHLDPLTDTVQPTDSKSTPEVNQRLGNETSPSVSTDEESSKTFDTPSTTTGVVVSPIPQDPTPRKSFDCEYRVASDLYGLGVRIGAYILGASAIVDLGFLDRGEDISTVMSATLAFPLTVAWFKELSKSPAALVLPVFLCLVSLLSGPALLALPFQVSGHWQPPKKSPGPILGLAATYSAACGMMLWAVHNTWFQEPEECNVWWGFFPISTKSNGGHALGYVFVSITTAFSLVSLFLSGFTVYQFCSKIQVAARYQSLQPNAEEWILSYKSRWGFRVWIGLSATLYMLCMAGVEVTLWKHNSRYGTLGDKELGQWIALAAAVASVLSIIRPFKVIRKIQGMETARSPLQQSFGSGATSRQSRESDGTSFSGESVGLAGGRVPEQRGPEPDSAIGSERDSIGREEDISETDHDDRVEIESSTAERT